MRPAYEKYQKVDDYLNNKLSSEETMEFEKLLKEDPAFREEVYDQKLTNEIIIEKRFFDVVGSLDLAYVSTGSKAILSNSLKTVLGITVTAGIGLLAFVYLDKSAEQPKAEKKEVPAMVKETEKKPQAPIVENIQEEKVQEPLIADDGKTDNVNLGKNVPAAIPAKKKAPASAPEEEVSWTEEGTYVIEIPLDGHNQSTYKFNPDKGEKWSIPLKGNKNAVVKILDQTGQEVHRVKVSKGLPKKWNGNVLENEILEAGNYIYLIDFGNGKMEHGYFSIIRSNK